jgi:para-aminobenzoate synthetase / 4-amino-4-deoxychorismate lyase
MADLGQSQSRPDPAAGVFETLLVAGGRPIELDGHLERLDHSVRTLYGQAPPSNAAELIEGSAAGIALGRLRLTVAPASDGLAADVVTADVDPALVLPGWERPVRLAELTIAGGLGEHKWADRGPLAQAEADPSGAVPLIVDGDGTALEASRANVFAIHDGVLVTPPADGRILPGVARGRVIELARANGIEVRERSLTLAELSRADEVLVTGSVRGIEPVSAIGDETWPRNGTLTAALTQLLRERWELDGRATGRQS